MSEETAVQVRELRARSVWPFILTTDEQTERPYGIDCGLRDPLCPTT